METTIKNLRYGQFNEKFCLKKSLNDKDKIIFKKIIKLAKNISLIIIIMN
jgi:hypothetical protein